MSDVMFSVMVRAGDFIPSQTGFDGDSWDYIAPDPAWEIPNGMVKNPFDRDRFLLLFP
uniref:Uncharacterized protein n=1 Tax=Candidatus Kentrum sp. TUN TaxID=2126343 RepID=A0A450ZRI3_9GAMM|nr:MAG: hypothetical protein BECKTUN1418F_GA0071002_100631 [Candidatus Kentron sp. TUN]VFK52484.1 MAG: hypothetical protein BECKTUN1418E_GA0071001_100830 [Candidatus Kentron sp. TUN]VFK56396.1 MAG: hypothetical protein BECKTUN1418D_GA0071000_10469 [Candidatus Kentron sp. TUN]